MTSPAVSLTRGARVPGDQIVAVVGEVGPWQLQKFLIVFLCSVPGLAHIFVSAFISPQTDWWCGEGEIQANTTKVIADYITD